jgi:HEPN pEK499 p136
MNDKSNFDPRLILAANRSFGWIFKCHSLYDPNQDDRLRDLLAPHIHDNGCDLINPGLVLAACYIYFVYPRETVLEKIDLSLLDSSAFKPSKNIATLDLIRRIRNSLSHGRFEIDDKGMFVLRDNNPKGTDPFETEIHYSDLGEFAEEFAKLAIKSFSPNDNGQ